MTLQELLSSDMTTIARAFRAGFGWWRDELAALLPPALLRWGSRRPRTAVFADGAQLMLARNGQLDALEADGGERSSIAVLLKPEACLIRSLDLPPMSRRDMQDMLTLEADRYFPMPLGSGLFAASSFSVAASAAIGTEVAAIPLERAEQLVSALDAARIEPSQISIATPELIADPRFDFLPAMVKRGLLPPRGRERRAWWTVVALLFVLNIAMVGWRDAAEVARLQEQVESQRPSVVVAQRILAQMRSAQALAQRAVRDRQHEDALAIMGEVTRAIPDGAWVQRYSYEGNALRLTGYKREDADVAAALRRLPRVASVESAQADEVAELAAGQPFDVVAELRRPGS